MRSVSRLHRTQGTPLIDYVAEFEISRAQVVAITEPMDGTFTLIYEPRERQNGHAEAVVTIAEAEEALEELFGTPITPVQVAEEVEETVVHP